MKKRILSLFLVLTFCMGLAVPALAGGDLDLPYAYLSVAEQTGGEDRICPLSEDGAGSGWNWNAATQTLTLSNYKGGSIEFNGYYRSDLKLHLNLTGSSSIEGSLWFYKFGTPGKEDNNSLAITGDGSLTVTQAINSASLFTGDYTATMADGTAADLVGDGRFDVTYPVTISCAGSSQPETPIHSSEAFSDVAVGAYYADPVAWAVENNITNGTTAATFSPDAPCSRAQIITFLWRATGSPEPTGVNPFSDVAAGSYYEKAVTWAAEQGMVSGAAFAPEETCTRAMAVEFMWKQAGSPTAAGAGFADISSPAVDWAVAAGVTNGTSASTFGPGESCNRGQIVTFLYRAFA